jgi:apolipoprotein N-acyltransferase
MAVAILVFGGIYAAFMLAAFWLVDLHSGIVDWFAPLLVMGAIATAIGLAEFVATTRRKLAWSLLFGAGTLPFWFVTHLFIWAISGPGFIPLLLHFCLYPAAFVWLLARLHARRPTWPLWLTAPILWVGLELLRGEIVWSGYPWYLAGHAATPTFGSYNPGSIIGAYGVSLLVAFAACTARLLPKHILARTEVEPRSDRAGWWYIGNMIKFGLVAAVAGVGLLLGWLGAPADADSSRHFRFAVLQTNLPQDNKLSWKIEDRVAQAKRWYALTAQAAAANPKPDAIFWPETMFPGNALNPEALRSETNAGLVYRLPDPTAPGGERRIPATWFADELIRVQREGNVPIVVGALAADGQRFDFTPEGKLARVHADARYNSAILIRAGRVEPERYDKMDLMEFGEYIPVVWRWPALQNQIVGLGAAGMAFDLQFGQYRTVFTMPPQPGHGDPVRIVTPICFEGSYPRSCRRLVAEPDGTRRADLMVNLTNDGWFGSMGALSDFSRRMHLLNCRWRCIELGTPMVRAANTGISCVIDQRGTVLLDTLDPAMPGGPREPSARHEGLMTADVPLLPTTAPMTIYARFGHWLEPVMGIAAMFLGLIAIFGRVKPIPTV